MLTCRTWHDFEMVRKNWEEARARLVEQRQSIVKALAKGRRIKTDIDFLI